VEERTTALTEERRAFEEARARQQAADEQVSANPRCSFPAPV